MLRSKISNNVSMTKFAPASEAFINGYALAIYRAMADYIEENRYHLVGASLMPERAVAE